MNAFPEFMRNPANRIVRSNQTTPGVEGYVFDGADQSQMAFWTCTQTATSAEHVHEFDEYMLVVQGCYTLLIDGRRIPIKAGEETVRFADLRYFLSQFYDAFFDGILHDDRLTGHTELGSADLPL